jgi:probable rRNA maturation factor
MLEIEITEAVSADNIIKKAAKKSAKAAARLENKKGTVSLLFTDDDNIRRLNKQYRGKDAVTDVLSFPSGEEGFLGDIALSLPRALEQAKEYGHSGEREVAFLVAHSMLHLFGYGHDSEDDERAMRKRQREIMKKAGYEL